MSDNNGKALYYPYIHIQNENWLKASLLYWDEISRIVPSTYDPEDSDDIKRVIDAGLLRPIYPKNEHKDRAGYLFLKKVLPLVNLSNDGNNTLNELIQDEFDGQYLPTGLISLGKISTTTLNELRSLGVARQTDDFVDMNSHLAGFYMTCLASVISEQERINAFSDSPGYTVGGEYITNGSLENRTVLDPVSLGLSLKIGLPSITDLQHISMSKIIDTHRHLTNEKHEFRSGIEEIRSRLIGWTNLSPIELENVLIDVRNSINRYIQKYQIRTAKILGLKLEDISRGGMKLLLMATFEQVFGQIDEPVFSQTLSYVFAGLGVDVATEKLWFYPQDNYESKIAHFMLPLKQELRN